MSVPPLPPSHPHNSQPTSEEYQGGKKELSDPRDSTVPHTTQVCHPHKLYRTDGPESDLETLLRKLRNLTEKS